MINPWTGRHDRTHKSTLLTPPPLPLRERSIAPPQYPAHPALRLARKEQKHKMVEPSSSLLSTHLQISGYHYPFVYEGFGGIPSSSFYGTPPPTGTTNHQEEEEAHHRPQNNRHSHQPLSSWSFSPQHPSSSTVVQLLLGAVPAMHLQSLELRFIEFDRDISDAFQSLLDSGSQGMDSGIRDNKDNNNRPRKWNSISLTGCTGLSEDDFSALALILWRNQCLHFHWQHNVGSEAGLVALGMALSASTALQTFQMTRHDLQKEQDIQALLGRGIGHVRKVVFNFCKFSKVDALADALAHNTSLEELDLAACYLNDDQLEFLLSALYGHPSLKILLLPLNSCHTKGAEALGRLLHHPRCQLQVLRMGNQTPSRPSSMTTTSSAITTSTTTLPTCTSSNKLNVQPIARALIHNQSLQELRLGYNRLQWQDKGVMELFTALELNQTLHTLDLSGNDLNDQHPHQLQYASRMAHSLQKATGLVHLDLNHTGLSSRDSGQALLETVQSFNHSLTTVRLPRSIPQWSQLHYELVLNASGRRWLKTTSTTTAKKTAQARTIPLGLWPFILERTTRSIRHDPHERSSGSLSSSSTRTTTVRNKAPQPQFSLYGRDALYYLLRNAPALTQRSCYQYRTQGR